MPLEGKVEFARGRGSTRANKKGMMDFNGVYKRCQVTALGWHSAQGWKGALRNPSSKESCHKGGLEGGLLTFTIPRRFEVSLPIGVRLCYFFQYLYPVIGFENTLHASDDMLAARGGRIH